MAITSSTPSKAIILSVGSAGNGGTANSADPKIAGTADAGTIIRLYDGVRLIGSTQVALDGSWSITPTADLKAGKHQFTAISIDGDAWGASSDQMVITIPTISHPPAPPEVTSLIDNIEPVAGPIPQNGWTDDPRPVLHGTAEPGSTITVFDGATQLGTASTGLDGKWSFQPDERLSEGPHAITATQTTASGTSGPSVELDFKIDTSVPPEPELTLIEDNVGPITGPVGPNGTTDDNRPVLSGTGVAGFVVNLFDNGQFMGAVTVEHDGTWSYRPTTPLADGDHTITLTQSNPATGATSGVATQSDAALDTADDHALLSAQGHSVALAGEDPLAVSVDENTDHRSTGVSPELNGTEHASFIGGAGGNEIVNLNVDPTSYLSQASAHIEGASGGSANTLHLTGDHQILDLTSLTGKTAAAKISGIEVIDLGGHSNTLKLSLTDVLNLGETDLFQKDGNQQMMITGSGGDKVDLSSSRISGLAEGEWEQHGTTQVGGVTYNVYEHSGAHAELLVQGVQLIVH